MDANKDPIPLDDVQIATGVHSEMARVFVERLSDSTLIAPLGLVLSGWLIQSVAGWTPALIWLFGMAVIELMIVFVGYRFQRCLAQNAPTTGWLRAQLAVAFLVGLGWSSATWFVWVDGQFLAYLTMLCVLVGVSGICMVVMAPQRMATLLFSLGLLVPPLVQIARVNNPIGPQLALGWLVMIVVQAWTARDLRRELVQELQSALRNRSLVQQLSRASSELQQAVAQKEQKNAELAEALGQLENLVSRDQLTGAYSRRYIFEQMEHFVAMRERHGIRISAVMFDLDHFKTINDSHGHPTGDLALQEVVRAVSTQLREGDLLARVGGEEFLVLLPMTDLHAAVHLTDRLRQTLSFTTVSAPGGSKVQLPASFGVAELQAGEGHADWFKRLDAALYLAKQKGRNTLVAA